MRKRILLVTLLVSVLGIVLLSVLFSDVFYRQSIEAVNGQLQIYMDVYAAERQDAPLDGAGAEAFAAELRGVRVTFLSADGAVLGDSEADASAMENHASREEVAEALASGEGFAVRDSATLGYDSVYYCRAFEREGQTYLVRLATQADSGIAIFVDALPTVLLLLAVDILVCLLVAWLATSFILRPVEKLTRAAASSGGKEVHTSYPELQPLAKMMNDMNAEIGAQLARIREDRSIEKLVLNSMEHGIVIFRSDEDVLLINRTARYLLGYEKNEPIACFTEDAEIAAVLAAGEPAALARRIGEREYSFRFTFEKPANVLLITDMTDIMAAARSKNDFIANVTHEMNTPLTSIRGFAELIGAGAIPPEKLAGVADTIIRQSDRLSRLIRSIINFSAIDSDDLPDYEVDLTEVVRELAGNFEPSLRQKGISFTLEAEEGVKVLSRRERLVEILNNLISNGIRYNKEGGSLAVRLAGGASPVLSVSDTGIGISKENQSRIFDRFYTVDKSHNGGGGGFGLGLATVKKLCRRAGWKLSVESEEGVGTTFTIEFCPKKQ
ncbi:MAG TPA: hypothetical protein H9737_02830 [Candidatus Borkfalkia faecigallinarum]|uniref:histidine kinase n=1 Tax=Candidatus Borkfalkia faecigallinarum TaxID=2838509 RepID=A0A9D1VU35_9FIRM|nr:hypothetical protein [Candidatus Borkfalkia faecigallinarum]